MKVTRDKDGTTYLGYDDPDPVLQALSSKPAPEPRPEGGRQS